MKKSLLFAFLFVVSLSGFAQYSTTPSSTGFANASFSSCGSNQFCDYSYIGGEVKMFIDRIVGNTAYFRVVKCGTTAFPLDVPQFSTTGYVFIKSGSICGTIEGQVVMNGSSTYAEVAVTLNPSQPLKNYYAVYIPNYNPSNPYGSYARYASGNIQITGYTPALPDLIIDDVNYPSSSVVAGNSISFTHDIRNIDNGNAGVFTVRYYLSTSTIINSSSIQLGSSNTYSSGLPSSHLYENVAKTLTIPSNTALGNYYIIPFVDSDEQVTESNESNNKTGFKFITVTAPTLTIIDPPSNSWGFGQTKTISWSAANGGCGPYMVEVSTNGGSSWTLIGDQINGTSMNWVVGKDYQKFPISNMLNNPNLRLKVYCQSNTNVNDESTNFSLTTASISVNTPPTLTTESVQNLTWTINNAVCTQYTIELSTTGGSNPFYLLKTYNLSSSYIWTVPKDANNNDIPSAIGSSTNRLKVYCTEYSSINGQSNNFTINAPTPVTTISQPILNYAYQRVQDNGNPGYLPIRWNLPNWNQMVKMELWRGSDNTFVYELPEQVNDGVYDWEINQTSVPSGEYKLLIYPANTTGSGQWSDNFKIINAPGITAPANGSQQTQFNNIAFTWNKNNPDGLTTYQMRLVDITNATNPVEVFNYTDVGDVATYTPSTTYQPNHEYRWVVRTKAGVNNQYAESPPFTFTIADDPNCPNCMTGVTETDFTVTGNEGFCAAQYLCSVGIINADQSPASSSPTSILIRQDAANVLVKSILTDAQISGYNQNPANVAFPTRINVTPFEDLNNDSDPANYHQAAKVLIYLSYASDANSITPFRKTGTNFYPGNGIARIDFLKLICESFDVPLDVTTQNWSFTDVAAVHSQSLKYLRKAFSMQLVSDQPLFRPYDNITREEAFLIIARLRKNYPQYIRGKEALEKDANYLFEQNVTANTASIMRSMAAGNFAYSEPGFAIPDIGFPLSFGFTYSSVLTAWPDAYRKVEPLGIGWTHNFNSYILPTDRSVTPSGVEEGKALLLLANGDGTFHTFDNTNNLSPTVRSIDTYNDLTVTQSGGVVSRYEVKRPDQVVFTYEKVNASEPIFRVTKITDRYGNQLSLTYKAANNVANSDLKVVLDKVTAPSGRFITFEYYSDNKLYRVIFPGENTNDRELRFDYHAAWDGPGTERLQKYYNPKHAGTIKATRYIYGVNEQGNATTNLSAKTQIYMLQEVIRPKGNRIKVDYDRTTNKVNGVEQGVEGSSGFVSKTTYNRDNCPVGFPNCSVETGSDQQQYTHYLNENDITYEIHSNSFIMKLPEYNLNPTTPAWFEVNGLRHGYAYNGDGLMLRDTTYDRNGSVKFVTQLKYDGYNNLTTVWDANANGVLADSVVSYKYSPDGKYLLHAKQRTDASTWLTQEYKQFANGLLEYSIDPEGLRTNYGYNAYGNVNDIHYVPLNLHATATYDFSSRVKTSTNAKNQTSQTFYDKNGNVVRTVAPAPLSYETKFRFDDNDNLTEIENAKGKITYMRYDSYDRMDSVSFEGATQKYYYNNDDTSPNFGRTTVIRKPWANRTTGKNPGRAFQFAYDTEGFLKANGYIQDITYKRNGTGASNQPDENTLLSIRGGNDPNHELKGFKYDELIRLDEYTDHFGNKVGYNYDNNGNMTQVIYPGTNNFVTYQYDRANRLTKVIWNGVGGLRTIATYVYANSRLDYVQYGNGVRTKYSYDTAGRLAGFSTNKNSGTGAIIAAYSFEFDNVGNHKTENITEPYDQPTLPTENTTYTYNDGNEILTMGSTTFTHDGDGNVVTKGNKTYNYDLEDNLTRITENGTEIATFTYDAFGNRRVAVRNGVETRYVLDLMGLDDVLAETNAAGSIQNYYIHGMGLVARVKADGTLHYYHGDYRGSVVAMTNAAQSITHQYQYDDFGKLLNEQEADPNPFKYVGLYGIIHEGPDLAYMRARYYDPETGRFNSADPIWATNLYPYANNNGVMNVDPTGELPILIAVILAYSAYEGLKGAYYNYIKGSVTGETGWILASSTAQGFIGNFYGSIIGIHYFSKTLIGAKTTKGGVSGFFEGFFADLNEDGKINNSPHSYAKHIALGSIVEHSPLETGDPILDPLIDGALYDIAIFGVNLIESSLGSGSSQAYPSTSIGAGEVLHFRDNSLELNFCLPSQKPQTFMSNPTATKNCVWRTDVLSGRTYPVCR